MAPLLTVVARALPPAATASVPPLERRSPLAVPPEETVVLPPLPIVVWLAMPPEETIS